MAYVKTNIENQYDPASGLVSDLNTNFGDIETSFGNYILSSEKGANNGVAQLGADGKVPTSQIPDLAISEYIGNFVDLTTALADSGVQSSQRGDWFTTDEDSGSGYIVVSDNPTIADDVKEILTPGSVASVNGQTGVVSLDADDISNGSTNAIITLTQETNFGTAYTHSQLVTGNPHNVLATQISDFDTEVSNNTSVVANTAKVTNATHTGEVTGSTALTIADNVVDEANLKLDESPTNGYVLTADSTKSGGMKWAVSSSGFSDPMTTRGDIIIRDNTNTTTRLGVGTNGQVLTTDGTDISWGTVSGGGDVSKVGTPIDNQVGVWTGDGTIEGTTNFTYDGSNLLFTGDLGITGTRITKGWFTDLEVTNAIAGSITGQAGTVATISGLAPDTATTQATQANITTCENLTTIGTVTSGGLGTGAVLGGVTMTLGSDADLDIYYRSSGVLTRLPKGAGDQVLSMNGTADGIEWSTISGTGTVTSVAAGNGLDFTTITGSGSVTMGTPSSLDADTTNGVTATSHTHTITTGISDNNIVQIDSAGVASGEYAKFTANGLESKSTTETKAELVPDGRAVTGTTYTLALTDAQAYLRTTNASDVTLTIPTNSSVAIPIDTEISGIHTSVSTLSFSDVGVNVHSVRDSLTISTENSTWALKKVGTDEWDLTGGLD